MMGAIKIDNFYNGRFDKLPIKVNPKRSNYFKSY